MIKAQKAVIKHGDKFLILKRVETEKYFPGCWDFPGGKLEEGEDPFQGIEREALEESGLIIRALSPLGTYPATENSSEIQFTIYSTEITSGRPKISKEHSEYTWATKEEILSLELKMPYFVRFFQEHPEL